MRTGIIAGLIALGAVSNAAAQDGPRLLTQFGESERAARSGGVTIERTKGATLIRGARSLAGDEPTRSGSKSDRHSCACQNISVDIVDRRPFRSIRRLRTQGFYSGRDPLSRSFTQGFFADY